MNEIWEAGFPVGMPTPEYPEPPELWRLVCRVPDPEGDGGIAGVYWLRADAVRTFTPEQFWKLMEVWVAEVRYQIAEGAARGT